MTFNPTRITDPAETKVVISIRVPWRAREELHDLARERAVSFNQLLTDAITAATGIEL